MAEFHVIFSGNSEAINGQYTKCVGKKCNTKITVYNTSPEDCMVLCGGNPDCGGFFVFDSFIGINDCYFGSLECKDNIIASPSVVLYVKN